MKRQSVDSTDFDIRGSDYSLEGSTASGEVKTTISEMSTTSAEVSSTITEVPATSVEVSTTKVETSTTRAESDKSSEIANPQIQEASVVETFSEVKIVSTVHKDLEKDNDAEATPEQPTEKDESLAKQDSLNRKLTKEALEVESEVQTFEFKLQSSVISSEAANDPEGNKEQHYRGVENKNESVQLVIEERVSTPEKDQAHEPESGHKYEVHLEDVKTNQDREIMTSSEDDSVNTVVSAEANKGFNKIIEEIGTENRTDVEEPILSTYHDKNGPLQSAVQELPPIDEDAIVLSYENKAQEEGREEQHVQEEPIALASKERREELVIGETTFQAEPATEAEPVLLVKSEKAMTIEKIPGEGKEEKPSEEELLIPTFVQRKEDTTGEEEQQKQEATLNEEAMALSYPEREEDQLQNESQDGPTTDEAETVVPEINEKKGDQIEEQIENFLKLDAEIEERSTQENETAKKDKEVEKIPTRDTPKKSESPERKKFIVDDSQNVWRESAPFKTKRTFVTSTPKQKPVNTEQGKTVDENDKAIPAVSYNIARFKEGSVVAFHLNVQIVNNIKDAKMSAKLLLARLVEINKRLRMLQKELLEVQKGDENNQPTNTAQVSIEI